MNNQVFGIILALFTCSLLLGALHSTMKQRYKARTQIKKILRDEKLFSDGYAWCVSELEKDSTLSGRTGIHSICGPPTNNFDAGAMEALRYFEKNRKGINSTTKLRLVK